MTRSNSRFTLHAAFRSGKATFMASRVFGAIAIAAAVLAPSVARAALVPPAGLNAGDPYRIIFVTSDSISGIQDTVNPSAVYNNFVNNAANAGGSELASLGTTWSSLTSVEQPDGSSQNAFDNIGGAFSIPVYTPAGVLVAANSAQLWGGGSIDAPININEFGSVENTLVWTGSTPAGVEQGHSLNSNNPGEIFGKSSATDASWISLGGGNPNGFLPVYGISGTLIAEPVPEPTMFVVWAGLGLVGLGFGALRKRYRRA